MPLDTRRKIVIAEQLERDESTTALAYGRFDVLTADHCTALVEARAGVNRLVVTVAPDSAEAPTVLDESSRAQLAAALGVVDRVVICDRAATDALVARLAPVKLVDVESRVRRDIVADVLRRHRSKE